MLFGVVIKGAALAVAPDFCNDSPFFLPHLPHINDGSRDDDELRSTIGKIVPPQIPRRSSLQVWSPVRHAGAVFFLQKTNFNPEKSIGPKLQNARIRRAWGMASSTCTQNPISEEMSSKVIH